MIPMKKMMARELGSSEAGGRQLTWAVYYIDSKRHPSEEGKGKTWPAGHMGMTQWKDAASQNSARNEPQPAPE